MSTSTHPISCLARTDAEISTCYHSFFLIRALVGDTTTNKNAESGAGLHPTIEVVARIPTQRYQIQHIESGLTIFIASIINSPALDRGEASGTFLLTSSDGSRYYAFWNGLKSNLFVAISRFPHFSFTRQIISIIAQQSIMMMHEEGHFWGIRDMLLTLCETPILPTCGVRYELQFDETSVAQLEFNSSEQISDVDSIMIVLSIFTPDMLLSAWESVMLERKVLVVSTNTSIIAPCCDFIRRLVLPLNVVNTYVPLLPAQLINAIEAPFPYLIGAETGAVIDSEIPIDLSHIVVIDLDQRRAMMPPTSPENPDVCAPPGLVHVLLKEVNDIMMKPYSDWISRAATTNNHSHNHQRPHPFVPQSMASLSMQADALLQLFIRTNLSLISARDCTVKAFFRRLELHKRGLYCPEVYKQSIPRPNGPLGFDLRFGVAYGCMQLLRLRKESTDTILHFLTCWVELDESALAVYEHADELPLLYINTKDIQAVSPSAMEPEGHVFEIITTQLVTSTYKLIATDFESRRQWITLIEEIRQRNDREAVAAQISSSSSGNNYHSNSHLNNSHHRTSSRDINIDTTFNNNTNNNSNNAGMHSNISQAPVYNMGGNNRGRADSVTHASTVNNNFLYQGATAVLAATSGVSAYVGNNSTTAANTGLAAGGGVGSDIEGISSTGIASSNMGTPPSSTTLRTSFLDIGLGKVQQEPGVGDMIGFLRGSYSQLLRPSSRFHPHHKDRKHPSGNHHPLHEGIGVTTSSPNPPSHRDHQPHNPFSPQSGISGGIGGGNDTPLSPRLFSPSDDGLRGDRSLGGGSHVGGSNQHMGSTVSWQWGEREEQLLGRFRAALMRTQMASFLLAELEHGDFHSILNVLKSQAKTSVTTSSSSVGVSKGYISAFSPVGNNDLTSEGPFLSSPDPTNGLQTTPQPSQPSSSSLSKLNSQSNHLTGNDPIGTTTATTTAATTSTTGSISTSNPKSFSFVAGHITAAATMDCFVDSSLARFLMRGGTIVGLLDQMNQENDNDELQGVLEVLEEGRLLNELAAQNQEGLFDSTPTPTETPSVNSDYEYDGELDQALDDYLELGYNTTHDNTDHCTTDDKELGIEIDEKDRKQEEDDDDEFGDYDRVDDDDDMDDPTNASTTVEAHGMRSSHTYPFQSGTSSQEIVSSRDSCDSDLSDLAGVAAASSAAFCGVFLPSVAYLNEPLALTNSATTLSTSTSVTTNGITTTNSTRDNETNVGKGGVRERVQKDVSHQNNTTRTTQAKTITAGIVYPSQNHHPTHHHTLGMGTSSGMGVPATSPCLLTSASLSGGFMRINASLYARKKPSPCPSTDSEDDEKDEKQSRFCPSPALGPGPGPSQLYEGDEGVSGNGTSIRHRTSNGITDGGIGGSGTNTDGNLDRLAWQRYQQAKGDWAEVDFSAVKMLLLNVASSHRRATAELTEKLVEDRMAVMAALAEAQLSSSSSSSSSSSMLVITIPIGKCCSTAVSAVHLHASRSDGRTTPQSTHHHKNSNHNNSNVNNSNFNHHDVNPSHPNPFDCLWDTLIEETQPSHISSNSLPTRTPSPPPPSHARSMTKHGRDENIVRREVRKTLLAHITELLDATTASSIADHSTTSATTTTTTARSGTEHLQPQSQYESLPQQQRVVHIALAPVLQV